MKKFICLFSLITACLHAAPVGNPAAPHVMCKGFLIPQKCWANIRLGYEGDFVFDGEMKQTLNCSSELDRYSQVTHAGSATLTLLERLDLYGVFGSSRFSAKWRYDLGDEIKNAEMESKHAFLWAFGGRAILYSWGKWDLGFGGRYTASHNAISWLTIDGVNTSLNGSKSRWHEWQLNSGVSYHIDLFTPYIGAYLLSARHKLEDLSVPIGNQGSKSNLFENRRPVGLYLGCSLSTGTCFMLNVEGRVMAEESLTVSGDLRF